jgi:hypothetical protein
MAPSCRSQLGQIDQIVVLGVLLGIMSLVAHAYVFKAAILVELRFGASTLQNIDTLFRANVMATDCSLGPRLIIITMTLLPVIIGFF